MRFELTPGMKPVDHPEFFRLPPPPGRSRESHIVLDESGTFWNGPVRVDHDGMALAFASWIRRHPDDGRYILENGYDWTYFTVKDVPFFVRRADASAEAVMLRLSDGTEERLDPASVSVAPDGVLYARVKGGDFDARFSATAQAGLVDVIVEGPDGEPLVEVAGERFSIRLRVPVDPC
jgi:hypothetical protein